MREPYLSRLYDLPDDGGAVVIIGGGPPARQNARAAKKDEIAEQTIAKCLGPQRRAGDKIYMHRKLSWENELFPKSRFGNYQTAYYLTQVSRNIDQIIGQLFSRSWAVRRHFGDRTTDFENEIRHGLSQALGARKVVESYRFGVYVLIKK